MRLFLGIILGTMVFATAGWTQEQSIDAATAALQGVLSNLKESVDKLSVDNDQLAARDNDIKAQVSQLELQLGHLQAHGNDLDGAVAILQNKNPRRAEDISRLEGENFNLDDHNQKAQASIKLLQQSLDAGYHEDGKTLLQLKGMMNTIPVAVKEAPPVESAASREALHLQMEKLKLMKMIYDSQQRQEALHADILKFQKSAPIVPGASALARQDFLKEQIKDLEKELAAYPPENASANTGSNQWDDTQLAQLESELKVLEKNYAQLKELMAQMTQKAQSAKRSATENIEGQKLQHKIDDLAHQSEGLRANLDDLRSQMVDLDKRKSRLEEMIKHLP